jgi:hypothetical protein
MNKNLSAASPTSDNTFPQSPTQSTSLLPTAIAIGIISFYSLFTLLPNSNSLMVKWPWVFIWQFGLMLGPIALLLLTLAKVFPLHSVLNPVYVENYSFLTPQVTL